MTRLYLRIFLVFWAVAAVTLAITSVVNRASLRAEIDRGRVETLRSSLDALADQAEHALDAGGEPGLRRWLQAESQARPEPPLFIVGPGNRELLDRALPSRPERFMARVNRLGEGDGETRRRGPMRVIEAGDGGRYVLFVPLRDWRGSRLSRPDARRNVLLVALLVSGGACFLLARWLTRPVRALREAGQRLASGDLDARVGSGIGRRRDELGALAREFDRMAQRLQALVGGQERLLREVSHELRSPLTRLRTAVELMRRRPGSGEDAGLDRIEREAERLDALIGSILSYSRLRGRSEAEFRPLDIAGLLAELVEDLRFEAGASGRTVQFEAIEVPPLPADEALLRSAVENVLRNAVAHARSTVRVSLRDDDGAVTIRVADDGPGVPEAELPRLFEAFYQVPGREHAQGAGLGLAIAARAVELQSGHIEAVNGAPGGLSVSIRLPRGPVSRPAGRPLD